MMDAKQLRDPDAAQAEITAMFAEILARRPDAVIVLAKCGRALLVRIEGTPADVVRLYLDTPDKIVSVLTEFIEVAAGRRNG